jgi:hypothetical protein
MITKNYLIGITLVCIFFSGYAQYDVKEDYGTVIAIDFGTTYSW